MEYLVWGAGKIAYRFINEYYACYFYNNPIKAIIDNNHDKWGSKFCGYSIISPDVIQEYSFDKIILCNHYDMISKQIVDELDIHREKITTKEEFLNGIYKRLTENYTIFKKRIVVLGDVKRYMQMKEVYTGILNVVDIVDYRELGTVRLKSFDYILLMNIPEMEGKGMGRMAVEEGLIKRLCQYGVERNRIVGDAEFLLLRGRDYPISAGGKENKDKIFLVYKYAGSGGLGALVYTVACLVAYAKERGYILVVDGQTCKNQYLEVNEVGRVNAWEKFFEQPYAHLWGGILFRMFKIVKML